MRIDNIQSVANADNVFPVAHEISDSDIFRRKQVTSSHIGCFHGILIITFSHNLALTSLHITLTEHKK